MDQLFQLGYVIGVDDTVKVMAVHVQLDLLPSTLRAVHTCAAQFTTIRSAVDFVTTAMQRQTDPLTPVAMVVYRTLNECDTAENAPNFTSRNIFALGGRFLWKDRWDNDLSNGPSPYIDGYVTGAIDLVRALDNSGKSAPVLNGDVVAAAACDPKIAKGRSVTAGQVANVALKSINGPGHDDPTESMSLAILEAFRACRQ